MGETRSAYNACRIVVVNPLGEYPVGRLREVGCVDQKWLKLAYDFVQW
jgi:hypothetical protein